MAFHPKKLAQQTIVITGASSGIGLATARLAARRGANVVLASRNEPALQHAVEEIVQHGGNATYVVADVAEEAEVERIAQHAVDTFGGFDTWINNAGVSVYGKIERVSLEDHRRLFETNFWGVVNGSRVALRTLKQRGGVLINLGSTVSDRAIPLQGMYSASKHAIKGFTDALRMELEHDRAPVAVVLIKPGAIDTQYVEHAKNYLDREPQLPKPVYAPEVVARTILHCAVRPRRDAFVGASAAAFSWMDKLIPRTTDRIMERQMFKGQKTEIPARRTSNSLHFPSIDGSEQGHDDRSIRKHSAFTYAQLHPMQTVAAVAGVGALMYAGLRLNR